MVMTTNDVVSVEGGRGKCNLVVAASGLCEACWHGAQTNFGNQTPSSTHARIEWSKHLHLESVYAVKKKLRDFWICLNQTFLGLGLGKLFTARESLVLK